ncbi:MAG TPA: SRPBCC domain-containing protein [Acidobacteriaceae bacterium]|nr:SRPBCC domain-containing protein [Acidobacteriaceae bacterium]
MSTQRYLVADLLRKGSRNQDSRARWDFWTHLSIPADIQSVFYALTEPEYMEAWLRAPGFHSARVARAGSDYSIQFRGDEASPIEIRGSWLSRYPGHIALTWNRNDEAMQVESTVSLEMRQADDRTLLHFYHFGFSASLQSLWHGELWSSSVLRLGRFTAVAGGHSETHVCAVSPLHRRQFAGRRHAIGTNGFENISG